ncbi:Threonylcarbamoyl-AMP synthase [uncultured archaeon]|nr:Threonylcarbamoyl-AMP synthase [uncultured archaeon]
MIVDLEKEYPRALAEGPAVLKKGGIIVFPTDTVYGLGGDARSPEVLGKIYKIKERERGKPLAVVMSGLGMIREWCEVYEEGGNIMREHLPGPYTFILKLKEGKPLAGQKDKIGVRIPNHFFLRRLVLEFGAPVIATSANISGKKDPVRFSEVDAGIIAAADLAINGGETALRQPSTVVDLVERRILRKGAGEFEFK